MMRTILVTGSRQWRDRGAIRLALLCEPKAKGWRPDEVRVIHGAAAGADTFAGEFAVELGYQVEAFPADWDTYGRAAGPIRNRWMLDECPDLVLAFGTGRGTEDTVSEAKRRGLAVVRFGSNRR